jgi:hypothetical protein
MRAPDKHSRGPSAKYYQTRSSRYRVRGLNMTLLTPSRVWRRFAKTADPSSAFVNAAKLILLVDVRGKDDFRAKSGLVMTT